MSRVIVPTVRSSIFAALQYIACQATIFAIKIYMDDSPTSRRLYNNPTNTDKKPISICKDKPHITHQWTESLTFKHDDYAHFISENCEPMNPIVKLLVTTVRLGLKTFGYAALRRDRSLSLHIVGIRHIPL